MKKLVALFLALALILGLSTTAFAAEDENFTLTINNAAGHTYDIYQIFTGDVAEVTDDSGTVLVLSNALYGEDYAGKTAGTPADQDDIDAIDAAANPGTYVYGLVDDAPFLNDQTPAAGASTITISDLPAGYYMIVDVTAEDDLPGEDTKSPIILLLLQDTPIASKHASIVSQKKVDDKNDSDASEDGSDWQDAADYDIGDDVPFQLSVTLPVTLNTCETYTLTFHDQQAAGFDDPTDFVVSVRDKNGNLKFNVPGVTTGNGYQVLECTDEDCDFENCSFTVQVGDIKALYTANQKTFAEGDQLIVEYKAELNSSANIGSAGNENGMYVAHPDGSTPDDYVTVFTYELNINKVDGTTQNALEGAGFTLSKWIVDESEAGGYWDEIEVIEAADGVTAFTFTGLDAGKYKLEETNTPAGYNTMDPLEFEVEAEHLTDWTKGNGSAFVSVTATAGEDTPFADADENSTTDGKLEGDIKNFKGTDLPVTGAKGTVMIIGTSSLVILMAAVFMITRKKMSIYED